MPPRVTVIIPAYNAEATIGETLASAAGQTWRDLEIIVVDDGSQDTTPDIIETHARRDSRIRLIRQANAGVAVARNTALAAATGRYAAWLDADDLWARQKIEKQLFVFASAAAPLSFVYTGYRLIDKNGYIRRNPRTLADLSGDTLCRQIATTYFTNISSLMVPVGLARHCGGHDPRLRAWGIEGAEDPRLQLRLAALGPNGCCRQALVGYRMHSANMSRAVARVARSNLKVLELAAGQEPTVPDWVFALGRARTVGFGLQMLAAGSVVGGLRFIEFRLAQDPVKTMRMPAMAAHWVGRAMLGRRPRDPEIGRRFDGADPATVPWEGHMLLPARDRQRLERADAERVVRRGVDKELRT
ncbi:MAG: glycosyltransferase family 2 protein [Alphaproteobacteria bacterium]